MHASSLAPPPEQVAKLLSEHGFVRVKEHDVPTKAGSYFYTRNQSSIIAYRVPENYDPANGFVVIGAHTDSPVLKLKPVTKISRGEMLCVGVECYGGGLWYTWFDRDLSIAGRVLVETADGTVESRLVCVKEPIVRIPNLAIHLNRGVNSEGFKFNMETELVPILASQLMTNVIAAKTGFGKAPEDKKPEGKSEATPEFKCCGGEVPTAVSYKDLNVKTPEFHTQHHYNLLQLIAKEAGCEVDAIRNFELCLYDTQPAQLTGLYKEFIASRALDNLMMSYCATEALIRAGPSKQIQVVALFDNEEIGSQSMMGADSNAMAKFFAKFNARPELTQAAVDKSILVSADMAHGIHPNYESKHESNHRPTLQKGIVIKHNGNLRYATNIVSAHHIQSIAKKYNIPVQQFCVRNDSPCGSTIGPMLSASCGIRTVDVGIPQWAMHSIRETCGVADVESVIELFSHVYEEFAAFDSTLKVDADK